MLAELHGKISRTGSNLHERLEDQLTGDFFGALRYIPFNDGIKKILCETVMPDVQDNTIVKAINAIDAKEWPKNICQATRGIDPHAT
jgi:hypothetical protein